MDIPDRIAPLRRHHELEVFALRHEVAACGSTMLYVDPKAPEDKDRNWLATVPGRGFFAILHLYAPTRPAIDLAWIPRGIEQVQLG
ncbi:DUF1214 domain-containing protein [Silvimonas iriomotensis]|uniref:DUF1214 domain-containing protein n=1 Tax=Silvimonas iriomotensis TaxID=449662 RepID=UPI0035709F0A